MKLNDIRCADYKASGNRVTFVLYGTLQEAMALDKQILNVTDDLGEGLASFGGYEILGVEKTSDGCVRAVFAKELDPDTKQDIEAVHESLDIVTKRMDSLDSTVESVRSTAQSASGMASTARSEAGNAQTTADTAKASAEELTELVETTAAAIEELSLQVFAE